jgi:hypothetical protein
MQEDDFATATQSHRIEIEGDSQERKCFVIMPLGGTTKEHDKKYWQFFMIMHCQRL